VAFSIGFTGVPNQFLHDDPSIPSAIGQIVAGELKEEFVSSLYEWTKEDYVLQWVVSLRRFLDGADRAVLITFYANSKESSNLEWWALYRGESGIVHVQNHLPWFENLDREFSVSDAERFLKDRITVNEDGNRLSEWNVPLSDIESFFSALAKNISS
jgi:hypothetical protein